MTAQVQASVPRRPAGRVDVRRSPTAYPFLYGDDGPRPLWSHPGEGGPVTAVLALVLGTRPGPDRHARPAVVPTGATR